MAPEDAHSRHVADTSADVFRALYPAHRLGPRELAVLQAAAELHDIGLAEGQPEHHLSSRRMILEREVAGLSDQERVMAALVAGYHRRPVEWQHDELMADLPDGRRAAVLHLAGMLRIADGLDYSHDQAATVVGARAAGKGLVLLVQHPGAFADADVARANKKADLWNECARPTVVIESIRKGTTGKAAPYVTRQDPVPEAGRKIMLFHYERVLEHDPGTRTGEDSEELHDMRVAVRRLRSAFRLFRKPVGRDLLDAFAEDLKWLARSLGAVRDLDVGISYLQDRRREAGPKEQAFIDAFVAEQEALRQDARARMIACLDDERYSRFTAQFGEFLRSPWLFAECPGYGDRVEDFARRAILRQIKKVRKCAPRIDDAASEDLHALRIDCKRMRYAVEFFRRACHGSPQKWIDEVAQVQDVLGEIHDRDLRVDALCQRTGDPAERSAGRDEMVAFERARRKENLIYFLALWPRISSKKFRRQLERIYGKPA